MTITLILLACIMFTVIGWLLRQTINTQPWVTDAADDAVSGTSLDVSTRAIGLATFLAVATSLFALFISAYTLRMEEPDWRPVTEPNLLWINTAILILASVAFQWARNAAKSGDLRVLKSGLLLAGGLSIAFLIGQALVWQELQAAGVFVNGNPANGFFYLLTGVHGLHLLGGLWVWGRSVKRVWSGGDAAVEARTSVELCAVYWHFLLLVWAVLFGVLLST